jgi:hypothetical protein
MGIGDSTQGDQSLEHHTTLSLLPADRHAGIDGLDSQEQVLWSGKPRPVRRTTVERRRTRQHAVAFGTLLFAAMVLRSIGEVDWALLAMTFAAHRAYLAFGRFNHNARLQMHRRYVVTTHRLLIVDDRSNRIVAHLVTPLIEPRMSTADGVTDVWFDTSVDELALEDMKLGYSWVPQLLGSVPRNARCFAFIDLVDPAPMLTALYKAQGNTRPPVLPLPAGSPITSSAEDLPEVPHFPILQEPRRST